MTTMSELIPTLDDQQLGNLHANALRLEGTGAPGQQKAAAEMLPLITAELDARQAAKPKPVRKTAVKKKTAAEAGGTTAAAKTAKATKTAKKKTAAKPAA